MARPAFTIEERRIKNNLFGNMQNRFGNISENRDSTFSTFSETIGDELNLIRREIVQEFEGMQVSNATGEMLDNVAMEQYGLLRKPATYAETYVDEANVYFYVEEGNFGDINGGGDITIPAGTLISARPSNIDSNLVYEVLYDYILDAEAKVQYCTVRSVNTGYSQNIDKDSLVFHNFDAYTLANQNKLKVKNRFAILNGSDVESDIIFRSRLNNFLTAAINLNEDWVTLKAIMIPGVTEIKMLPNYFGIGSLGLIVFGSGRESSDQLIELVQNRVTEIASPGTTIDVVGGITTYIDFDIRVYVKRNLSIIDRDAIVNDVKRFVYQVIESAESKGAVRLTEISNFIISRIPGDNIISFGGKKNGSIFEKVFQRKTDRFNSLPEYKEEIVGNEIILNDDERVSFGIVNVILEEGEL
tara:strand:- start:63248 stop:64492 length:1245 start_codon:yes stop_codon:yes gene_type:complete